jgi:hypothetical protein
MKRHIGINIIGYFYIFGAIVLLLTLGIEQNVPISIRVGLEFLPELGVRIFISILFIIMSIGFINLKKWAYWAMVLCSLYMLVMSLNLAFNYQNQLFVGNAIFSASVLIYTIFNQHHFNYTHSMKKNSN